jgi:phytoene dehydrogenase-like protein
MKLKPYLTWNRISMADLLGEFTSPLIRSAIAHAWPQTFPAGFLLATLAWLHTRAAGYPIGGSLELSRAIEKRYLALGGEIRYRAKVARIIVEKDTAVGVRLDDGSEHRADFVVSAADGHATIFDMLGGAYVDATVQGYYEKLTPFPALVFVGLGIERRFDDVPVLVSGLQIELPQPLVLADKTVESLGFHIFNNDPGLCPPGHTVVACMFASDYSWWKNIQSDTASQALVKEEIVARVVAVLERRFPGITPLVRMHDVATPLTFERYTGNWRGSFEGWMSTPENWTLRMSTTLPGLGNFWMCGQWVEPGGGLPPSALSGRNVVQFICAQDRREFVTSLP